MMWQTEAPRADFEACVVYCTTGTAEEAERIGGTLVDEQLAACCTLLPGVTSIYRWKGGVQRDAECLLLIKSERRLFERLAGRIRELHSYEVPEIIAVPVIAASEAYLGWLHENLSAP
jgi:uncharacterized protein involved in tolerance to divalent cations